MAWRSSPRNAQPVEIRRGLPGDPDDTHSRYIEATVHGVVIGCLYLPNGNPAARAEVRLQARLVRPAHRACARAGRFARRPVVLAGDYNVVPTDFDIYDPKVVGRRTRCCSRKPRAFERLLSQGWTDALRDAASRMSASTPSGTTSAMHWARNAGLRIDHLLLEPTVAAAADGRRCRSRRARSSTCQRSRAGVGRAQIARAPLAIPTWPAA